VRGAVREGACRASALRGKEGSFARVLRRKEGSLAREEVPSARASHAGSVDTAAMRIAVAADERVGVALTLLDALRGRGHELSVHGALAEGQRADWAWAAEAAAREVAEGRAEQAVVCCWTGTGASIAANKVAGVRAALCLDAATAAGARRWNDANALALSLRSTSEAELREILDAWFAAAASSEPADVENVSHLREMDGSTRP
jgi:ribose 5-phosphate isomerase B